MPTYGYTIGDADNTSTSTVGFEVRRFIIPEEPTTTAISSELVGTLTGTDFTGDNGEDLEGLGTNPITQRISAVSEGPGLGRRVNNVDRNASAFSTTTQTLTGTSRQFDDSGADFYVSSAEVATLYNIQTEQIIPSGTTTRSILYSISATGAIAAVAGKTSTEFVDGLAIYNFPDTSATSPTTPQFTGNYYAFASDFATNDGDGAELHRVDLFGTDPLLSGGIQLRNPNGTAFTVPTTGDPDSPTDGFDSGLAFTRDGNRLIALWENGSLYEITNFLDDAYAGGSASLTPSGTVALGDGIATIRLLGTVTLPGTSTGTIEYEGFTITSEASATGNAVFTGV